MLPAVDESSMKKYLASDVELSSLNLTAEFLPRSGSETVMVPTLLPDGMFSGKLKIRVSLGNLGGLSFRSRTVTPTLTIEVISGMPASYASTIKS